MKKYNRKNVCFIFKKSIKQTLLWDMQKKIVLIKSQWSDYSHYLENEMLRSVCGIKCFQWWGQFRFLRCKWMEKAGECAPWREQQRKQTPKYIETVCVFRLYWIKICLCRMSCYWRFLLYNKILNILWVFVKSYWEQWSITCLCLQQCQVLAHM